MGFRVINAEEQKMRVSLSAAVAAGLALSVSAAAFGGTTTIAPVNLVQNGSFEAPVIAVGSYTQGRNVFDWTGLPAIEIESNGALGPSIGGTPFGNQYAELNVVYPSKILQQIKTVVGDTYILSFYLADRPGTGVNEIGVFFSGSPIQYFKLQPASTLDFHQFTETVKATVPLSNLSFSAIRSHIPSEGNEVDNVSLTLLDPVAAEVKNLSLSAAVPLPRALWPGLTVLAALALAGFRRKLRRSI
jgi:hypothetical protein